MPKISDHLKPLKAILDADPRSEGFLRLDSSGFRPVTITDHHAGVAQFGLVATVPEQIKIQFETAKNLYLYAWYVYRFYPVAEHHALVCLEHGLRERCASLLPKSYWSRKNQKPTMAPLLRFAVDSGAIQNQGFRGWHERVQQRARNRYEDDRMREMVEKDLDHIDIDYEQATPNDEDRDWTTFQLCLKYCRAYGTATRMGAQNYTIKCWAHLNSSPKY